MRRITTTLLIIGLLAVGVSCNEENEPNYTQWEGIVSEAELPVTAKVNEKVTMILSYPTGDTCDSFYKSKTEKDGDVITVTLVLRRYKEETCLFVAADKKVPYEITLAQSGTYTFRFFNGIDYTEYPLTVE